MPAPTPPDLKNLIAELVGDQLETPISDDIEDQAEHIAQILIEKLHLRRGSYFIDDLDETKPVHRFFVIDGSIDVDDIAEPAPKQSPPEGHIFNPYGLLARGLR